MPVRVKICGITNLEDALAAIAAGADSLGFVFVPGTPRYITQERASDIIRRLPPFVIRTGLFVDADETTIRRTIAEAGLDAVQLHGDEPPELGFALRKSVRVLKAFRVRGPATLELLPQYQDAADAWLLDAYVPGAHGGTGARFDWNLATDAKRHGKPIILAGGLTPENVSEAIRTVAPYAVDVSSGVESSPGKKDPAKVTAFTRTAKAI